MDQQPEMTREVLNDDIVLLRNIQTHQGLLSQVYLGSGGVFAVLEYTSHPSETYGFLRSLVQVSQFKLYLRNQGLYAPLRGSFTGDLSQDELSAYISRFLTPEESCSVYTPEDLECVESYLRHEDARTRGRYRTQDGVLYLLHHGQFQRASDRNSDLLYYTTLFGGVLGIHRFLMGKFWSGLLYLLTGGLLLCGWSLDILFLLFGFLKEKNGDRLQPPNFRLRKLLLLPPAFLVSMSTLKILFNGALSLSGAFQGLLESSLTTPSSSLSQAIYKFLETIVKAS